LLMLVLPLTDHQRLMLFDYAHLNGLWRYRLIDFALISFCSLLVYNWNFVIPHTDLFSISYRFLIINRTKNLFLFNQYEGKNVKKYLIRRFWRIIFFSKILTALTSEWV